MKVETRQAREAKELEQKKRELQLKDGFWSTLTVSQGLGNKMLPPILAVLNRDFNREYYNFFQGLLV